MCEGDGVADLGVHPLLDLGLVARRAVERDEFVVRYQPKVDLRDGRVVGAEALLRWRLPGHGDIPPAQFIPTAERFGLIDAARR